MAMGTGRADERLPALLAVAGGVAPDDGLLLLVKTVASEWQRGERALAAIRVAFAPVSLLDEASAYLLFLAEQALDAGLGLEPVLREFGLGEAAGFRKYDPDQPRVPAGSGRASGQFAGQNASSDGLIEEGRYAVRPVFFDDRPLVETKPSTLPRVSDE